MSHLFYPVNTFNDNNEMHAQYENFFLRGGGGYELTETPVQLDMK